MDEDKNKKFKFPDEVLVKINECSNGGYILFTIDQDGLPEVFSEFDDPTKAMALQYYIDSWTKAVEKLNTEMTAREITNEIDKNEDPDDLSEI